MTYDIITIFSVDCIYVFERKDLMKAFISNLEFNRISRLMKDLQRTLKFSADQVITAAAKDMANDEIKSLFSDESEDHIWQVDISMVEKAEDVDQYLSKAEAYVYSMKPVSESQIKKLFRKEKRLKLPATLEFDHKTYYGWFDQGKRKLYIVHWLEDRLLGMICNVKETEVSNSRMCSLCGHMNDSNEVVTVSAKCKASDQDGYHAIGFNVCKDSDDCNGRITSIQALEKLMRKVNRIK